MPAKTNSQHPQHVQTQSSKIAAEIEPILSKALEPYMELDEFGGSELQFAGYEMDDTEASAFKTELLDQLTTFIMAYQEADWYSGYKQGYQAARDGKEMTDKEAYDQLPDGHGARG